MTMDIPDWWYPSFGRNNASAVAWMQIAHSLGVVFSAIPVAGVLVIFFRLNWGRMAIIVAFLASCAMLIDVSLGFWRMRDIDTDLFALWKVTSALIDVFKLGGIFFLTAWTLHKLVPSNDPLHSPC